MKKTIAILGLAALAITSAHAGVHIGFSFGIPIPNLVVAAPAPVVVAPAPVVAVPAPVLVAPTVAVVPPPMPAPLVEAVPVCPVAGYVWLGGSWGWCNNHWVWTRGHWGAPVRWGYAHHGWYRGGHWRR